VEFGVALVALIVAAISLAIAIKLQADVARLRGSAEAAATEAARAREAGAAASHDAAQALEASADLHAQLAQLRDEVARLQTAVETPPPPLPRARSGNLEDLRERLRAEQEAAEGDDEEDP
jgi:hypothetical protein